VFGINTQAIILYRDRIDERASNKIERYDDVIRLRIQSVPDKCGNRLNRSRFDLPISNGLPTARR
jgi:hypothetical protein